MESIVRGHKTLWKTHIVYRIGNSDKYAKEWVRFWHLIALGIKGQYFSFLCTFSFSFLLECLIFSIMYSKEQQSWHQEIRWGWLSGVTVPTDGASANRTAAIWGNVSPKVLVYSNLIPASICGAGSLCHHI